MVTCSIKPSRMCGVSDHATACALGILTPVDFSYMMDKVRAKKRRKCGLFYEVEEVDCDVWSLVAFLQCARYGQVERFVYPWLVSRCSGARALLYVALYLIKL